MRSKVYIQLGKNGDILSIFPVLHKEWISTGIAPDLLVSDKYAALIEGVSYVNPITCGLQWDDLKGAIKYAKQHFDEVIIPQTHGNDFPINQIATSYQIDQYRRGGCLSDWDCGDYIIDRRNAARERELVSKHVSRTIGRGRPFEKFILFADVSESSKFEHIGELEKMLVEAFSDTHKIIKLSSVKAEYFFDLLGLYDRADALISIDTGHVHLSKFSTVPAFVLAADGWRGSACTNAFEFYLRYAEWERRKKKFISEIKSVIYGDARPSSVFVHTDKSFGYNLSEIDWNNRRVHAYRYHSGDWKTKIQFCDSGLEYPLEVDASISENSIEDLRLFSINKRLYGTYVVSTAKDNWFKCYVAYGEITQTKNGYKIGHIQPKYVSNDFSGLTKNWVPFVYNDQIHFIYGIKGEKQIVICVNGDQIISQYESVAPKWLNGEIRGGAIVSHGEHLLRFFHSRADYGNKQIRYFVGAALMESKPPFKTLQISSTSILSGDEQFTPNCGHYKSNVCYPMSVIKSGDKFHLSCGLNDCKSAVFELTYDMLKL